MDCNKVLDSIHTNVHGLRCIQGYKPSQFEIITAKKIVEAYKDTCEECRAVFDKPPVQQKNFLNKLGDMMSGQ